MLVKVFEADLLLWLYLIIIGPVFTILIWRILLSTQTDDLDHQDSDAKGVSAFTTG